MRKMRLCLCFVLFSLLFSACTAPGATYLYEKGAHTHVFGNRYDVTPVSCVAEGAEVRYCKICHELVTERIAVAESIEARAHHFSDTVIAPTESAEGYTRRVCTLCEYVVERADVVPARYALIVGENTITTALEGVEGILFSDTKTHLLKYNVGYDRAVSSAAARRLAVALAITDELAREGTAFTADTQVALVSGVGNGNRYTLRALLCEWIATGDAHVLGGFAFAFDGSEGGFTTRVNARLQKLGVLDAVSLNVFAPEGTGSATLGATAVMLARALDEPLLLEAFAESVPNLQQIAGQKPKLYLALGDLRLAVVDDADGTCHFSAICGETLPTGVENTLFSTND